MALGQSGYEIRSSSISDWIMERAHETKRARQDGRREPASSLSLAGAFPPSPTPQLSSGYSSASFIRQLVILGRVIVDDRPQHALALRLPAQGPPLGSRPPLQLLRGREACLQDETRWNQTPSRSDSETIVCLLASRTRDGRPRAARPSPRLGVSWRRAVGWERLTVFSVRVGRHP